MLKLFIHQVDIIKAYLKSLLSNNNLPIFMNLSPDIHNLREIWEGLIYRLLRSFYSLRQSGRLWNQNIIAFYKRTGFKQLYEDLNIFIKQTVKILSIMNVYVDDFLLTSNTMLLLEELKRCLTKEYNIKDLEEVKTIIR